MKNKFFSALAIGTFLGIAMPIIGMDPVDVDYHITQEIPTSPREITKTIIPNIDKQSKLMSIDECDDFKAIYPKLASLIEQGVKELLPFSVRCEQVSSHIVEERDCFIPYALIVSNKKNFGFNLNDMFGFDNYKFKYLSSVEERDEWRVFGATKISEYHMAKRKNLKDKYRQECMEAVAEVAKERDRYLKDIQENKEVIEKQDSTILKLLTEAKSLNSLFDSQEVFHNGIKDNDEQRITILKSELSRSNQLLQTMNERDKQSQIIDDAKVTNHYNYKRAFWFTLFGSFAALVYILKMHYAVAH